jgi:hypothetical protein
MAPASYLNRKDKQMTNKSKLAGIAGTLGALMLCASSAFAMPVTLEIRASSAPNVFGSPSVPSYTANALSSLENNLGNIGDRNTDPTAYEILNGSYTAGDVMVTSGNSWRGQANPGAPFGAEHGNRLHFGLHVIGDGVVRFRLNDLSFAITSSDAVLDFAGNFAGLTYNAFRHGIDWVDGIKGNGNDIVYMAGNGMTLVDALWPV